MARRTAKPSAATPPTASASAASAEPAKHPKPSKPAKPTKPAKAARPVKPAKAAAVDEEPGVVLSDPSAVRALAHPARLVVIDALYDGEVLNATECAERAGVTPSAMSYHLRALEKAGLVVRAEPRGDGRERPWKRAGRDLRVDVRSESGSNAAGLAAAELLVSQALDLDRQRLLGSIRADAQQPGRARSSSHYSRDTVLLTLDEMTQVSEALEAVLAPYRRVNRGTSPDDAVLISASLILVPENPSAS